MRRFDAGRQRWHIDESFFARQLYEAVPACTGCSPLAVQTMASHNGPQQGRGRRHGQALAIAVALAIGLGSRAGLAASIEADFSGRWVDPHETLEVRLADPARLSGAALRVMVGADDYSGVSRLTEGGSLVIDPRVAGLPSGLTELVIYTDHAQGWQELGRLPLRVRTPAGFEEVEVSSRTDLTNKSQWSEGRSGQSPPPQRSTFHDLAGNYEWQSRLTRDQLELRSRFQLVGSSVRQEALRFGALQNDAPKVDLSSYELGLRVGESAALAMGHLSVGNHPLLVNYLSSRGLEASGRLGPRLDYRAAAVAGQQVTGYNRLIGADFDDNTIYLGSVGFAPIHGRPDAMRVELAFLDAERPSQPGFNIGEVTDSEKSRGIGVLLKGRTPGGRIGGEISWARSRYVNPEDPLLSFGQSVVSVEEETNQAMQASLQFGLLQNRQLGDHQASLHLHLNYQQTDPLYRSLGAFVQPDLEQFSAVLSGQLGLTSLQLRYAEQEDNLDRIPTILKTRTRSSGLDLNWPLGALRAGPAGERSWWPDLGLRVARTHQFAGNNPEPLSSEFNSPSHLPDQVTVQYGLQASWPLPRGSVAYSLSFSDQDNRQPGREDADFQSLNHGLNLSWSISQALSLNTGLSRSRNAERERDIARYVDSANAALNWRPWDRLAISVNWQQGLNSDSLDEAEGRNKSLGINLAGNVDLPLGARRVPAQLFVSYARQTSTSINRVFGFDNEFGTWSLNSGLSFSF